MCCVGSFLQLNSLSLSLPLPFCLVISLIYTLEGDVEVERKGGWARVWVRADAGALDGLARRTGHAAAVARLQEVGAGDADHGAE